jgi:hypothetical protein
MLMAPRVNLNVINCIKVVVNLLIIFITIASCIGHVTVHMS